MKLDMQEEMVMSILTDNDIRYLNDLAFDIIQNALPSIKVSLDGKVTTTIDSKSQSRIDKINEQIQYRINSIEKYYREIKHGDSL